MTNFIDTLVQRSIQRGGALAARPAQPASLPLAAPIALGTAGLLASAASMAVPASPFPARTAADLGAPQPQAPLASPRSAVEPGAPEALSTTTFGPLSTIQPQLPEQPLTSMAGRASQMEAPRAPIDARPALPTVPDPPARALPAASAPLVSAPQHVGATDVRADQSQAAVTSKSGASSQPASRRTVIEPRARAQQAESAVFLPAEPGFLAPATAQSAPASSDQPEAPDASPQQPLQPGSRPADRVALHARVLRPMDGGLEAALATPPRPQTMPAPVAMTSVPHSLVPSETNISSPQAPWPTAILPRPEPARPSPELARLAAGPRAIDVHIGSIEVRLASPSPVVKAAETPPVPAAPPAGFGDYAARRLYRSGEEWL